MRSNSTSRFPGLVAAVLSLAFLPITSGRSEEVVNLVIAASGLPENVAKDGPPVELGNGAVGTTTVPTVVVDSVSGQGPVIDLGTNKVLRFDDASYFAFLASGTFTYSARVLVAMQPPEGSSYLLNHWAFPKTDRSLAIRLVAQGGLVRPQVTIRHADDINHTMIEPSGVNWPVGEWVNFAVVADNSMLSFWVNGVPSPTSYEIPAMRSSMLPLLVGSSGGVFADDKGLAVQIKNLKILNKAADEAWIKAQAEAK